MDCFEKIYGNDYYDFIVRNNDYLPPVGEDVCTLDGGNGYTILFASSEVYPSLSITDYSYNAIPNCYGPLSLEALDASGVLQVREAPALRLDGENVLIGFLDSGIDAFHPAFLDEAGNTRVVAVWNQNYSEEMLREENEDAPRVDYGRVYTGDAIAQYGNGDATGHGTFVASVAAGSVRRGYSGAAPAVDIAMVHLKQAKQYLKDFFYIPEETICYEETDLILGVKFLNELARSRNQALVICFSVGNALGSHSGNSPLDIYLDQTAVVFRRCVVAATGNMAAARRHFYGSLVEEPLDVEIVVPENTCGFALEQWAVAPIRFGVSLISPGGQLLPPFGMQTTGRQEYDLALEGGSVTVEYSRLEATTGNQLIYYRFERPTSGVWRIRVYPTDNLRGDFHMYLAPRDFQCADVFFLASNPDTTVDDPANALRVMSVGGYNQAQNSILLESGRGYTIDERVKPDLVAPAYLIDGAISGSKDRPLELQYEARTGTSGAVAITAGAAAMYLQWCDEQGDFFVNTTQVKNDFIRGAKRQPEERYPNRTWGYGSLDVYETFRLL